MPKPDGADQVLAEIDALAARIETEITTLEEAREEINVKIKRLQSVKRVLVPVPKQPQRKKRPPSVSPQRLFRGAEALLYIDAEEFTATQAAQVMNMSGGSAREVLEALRAIQFVGLAKRERVGKSGLPAQHWRIIEPHPENVVQQLKEAADAAQN